MPSPDKQTAFDLLPDAVFCVDSSTMAITMANQAACICLGHTREELQGMNLHQICPQQDIAALTNQFANTPPNEPATAILHTTQQNKAGLAMPAEWHVSRIRECEQDCWRALPEAAR